MKNVIDIISQLFIIVPQTQTTAATYSCVININNYYCYYSYRPVYLTTTIINILPS